MMIIVGGLKLKLPVCRFCSVKQVLTLPTEEQVGPTRLPNLNYPSDHIAIACDIHITPQEEIQENGNPGDQGL